MEYLPRHPIRPRAAGSCFNSATAINAVEYVLLLANDATHHQAAIAPLQFGHGFNAVEYDQIRVGELRIAVRLHPATAIKPWRIPESQTRRLRTATRASIRPRQSSRGIPRLHELVIDDQHGGALDLGPRQSSRGIRSRSRRTGTHVAGRLQFGHGNQRRGILSHSAM